MSCRRYEIDTPTAPREAVRLLYISKSRFGGDWHSTPHVHSCTELFYCLSGRGQFYVAGVRHNVEQDDLVIINPMVEHTELSLNANPLEYVVLGVEGVDFLFSSKNESYARVNCAARRDDFLFLFKKLLQEVDDRFDGCETVCQDLLEVLLLWLVRANNFTMRASEGKQGSKECAAARRYLDEHFSENITLDRLADVAHVNKYYLSHEFSREYQISPINYLIRRRIEESKTLLGTTNHSVGEISSILGFSSPSYFSQSFHKLTGESPAKYRREARAKAEEQTAALVKGETL